MFTMLTRDSDDGDWTILKLGDRNVVSDDGLRS